MEAIEIAKKYSGQTEDEKKFIQVFDILCQKHNPWTVWHDFVEICACVISNRIGPKDGRWTKREADYISCIKCYSQEEQRHLAALFEIITVALLNNPAQDFLGNLKQR